MVGMDPDNSSSHRVLSPFLSPDLPLTLLGIMPAKERLRRGYKIFLLTSSKTSGCLPAPNSMQLMLYWQYCRLWTGGGEGLGC